MLVSVIVRYHEFSGGSCHRRLQKAKGLVAADLLVSESQLALGAPVFLRLRFWFFKLCLILEMLFKGVLARLDEFLLKHLQEFALQYRPF